MTPDEWLRDETAEANRALETATMVVTEIERRVALAKP
jgi:hypothetical protein